MTDDPGRRRPSPLPRDAVAAPEPVATPEHAEPIGRAEPARRKPRAARARRDARFEIRVRPGPVVAGLGVVVFALSFFSFYTYRARGAGLNIVCSRLDQLPSQYRAEFEVSCHGIATNAWRGTFGWLAALIALAVALVIAGTAVHARSVHAARCPAGTGVALLLAVVFMLLAARTVPDTTYRGHLIDASSSHVRAGHGWAFWVALVALGLAAIVAGKARLALVGGPVASVSSMRRRSPSAR